MPGSLELERIVLEAIELSKTDESWRPLVYRKTIGEVIVMYNQNKWPFYSFFISWALPNN